MVLLMCFCRMSNLWTEYMFNARKSLLVTKMHSQLAMNHLRTKLLALSQLDILNHALERSLVHHVRVAL